METDCKSCARLRRAREAAASQLEALSLENEMLARQVAELTEALVRAQSTSPAEGADREVSPVESAVASTSRSQEAAAPKTSLPDVWADGDGRFPSTVEASVALPRAPKALAAALVPAASANNRLIVIATADKRLGLYTARSASGAAPSSLQLLASAAASSPIMTFSEAWPSRDGPATVLLAAGHMDGSVTLWAVSGSALVSSASSVGSDSSATAGIASVPAATTLRCVASAPAAHSKFAVRVIAQRGAFAAAGRSPEPSRDWAAAGPLILSASTDGTAALWRPEIVDHAEGGAASAAAPGSAAAAGSDVSAEPRLTLRRLQLLALPGPVTAAVWRPVASQSAASASADAGKGASAVMRGDAWPSFALAVSRSPYLWYCSVVGGAAAPRALVLRRVPLSEDGPAVELPHHDDGDFSDDAAAVAVAPSGGAGSAEAASAGSDGASSAGSSSGGDERPAWSRLLLASGGAGAGASYGSAPLSRTPITLPSVIPIIAVGGARADTSAGAGAGIAGAGARSGVAGAAVSVPQHPPAHTAAASIHLAPAAVNASWSPSATSPATHSAAALPDVLPVGWDVMDMDAADVHAQAYAQAHSHACATAPHTTATAEHAAAATVAGAAGDAPRADGSRRLTLLALATSTGLVLVVPWGSNRALRTLAGHTRHISPTFAGGGGPASSASGAGAGGSGASELAASLRVQWYPRAPAVPASSAMHHHAQPQYLLASSDAGNGVAVLALASQRPVATIGGAEETVAASASSAGAPQHRTTLRQMHVLAGSSVCADAGSGDGHGDNDSLLLTLDNSGNAVLRRCPS